jgi:hypothetical protein
MKIRMVIAMLAVVFATGLAIEARAQQPTRIRFAKGTNSAVIKATTELHGKTYVLRAKSGQKLVLKLTPESTLGIKVETVGRFGEMVLLREESGGYYEIGLEESGDYTIFIGSTTGKPVQFTLTVKIGKLADV